MKNEYQLAKGSFYIFVSYFVFYLSGYVINLGLTRIVSPNTYGTIGVIITILSLLQIFLTGIPASAAKFLSEDFDGFEIKRKTLLLQSVYAVAIAILIFFIAPLLSDLLNDRTYIPYIRFLSFIIIIRAISQLFDNFFNGYRDLKKQSILLTIDGFPKIIFVFLFVYWGYGIYGVLSAYALTSLFGIFYAICFFKPKKTYKTISYSKIIRFSYPIILFSIFFQLISSLDILFIKSLMVSEDYVGFYTSARVLSTLFVIIGATFSMTIFPSISKSYSRGDKANTEFYIKSSLRYIFLFFIPIAVLVSVYSSELLSLFFSQEYSKAANSLSILIWGWGFLQIFFVLATMINASGRSKIPAFIAGSILLVSFFCNYFFVTRYKIEGGAISTFIGGFMCFLAGGFYVKNIFQLSFGYRSLIKIISASLAILFISMMVQISGILLIAWCLFLFVIYFLILFFMKEIKCEDMRLIKELFHHFKTMGLR